MSHTRWNISPPIHSDQAILSDVSPLILQLLYNRGISDPAEIERFLHVDDRSIFDPFLLSDMEEAVTRTQWAIQFGRKIAIYGDFDADGITATALLVEGLSALGADVIPYIPNRLTDGYGLRTDALDKLRQQDVGLIITVDNGITAIDEVDYGMAIGIDIIVTDHHIPLNTLPKASAVINPKRIDSRYPFADLAGVGVAWKFLQAMRKRCGLVEGDDSFLDLVAIGTVADMMPLVSENRYWIKRGLEIINTTKRLGLQEMFQCAGIKPGLIETSTISWSIGPRINAAGRIDSATTSYKLLLTRDGDEAKRLASDLEIKNAERLQMTTDLQKRAREQIIVEGTDRWLLMAGDCDYPEGITGLVAGRLADEFYRPVILMTVGQESTRGSGRSIREFNIMAALEQNADILLKFGGHKRAAGFTITTANLDALKQRLYNQACRELSSLDLRPHIDVDADIPLSLCGGDTFSQIQRLAPFGFGNPVPVFLSRRVQVIEAKAVGVQESHLRMRVKDNGVVWDVMGFGLGDHLKEVSKGIDIVYSMEIDRWNGEEKLRLKLLDFS